MVSSAPRIVTLHLPLRQFDPKSPSWPLCADEMLALVDELADAGVHVARFVVRDSHVPDDTMRVIEYACCRRLAPVVALRGAADAAVIASLAEAGVSAIALPLHSHHASTHDGIEEHGDWSRRIHLANVVRHAGATLEIETRVTPMNALPLLPLLEVVEALDAARWRLEFQPSIASSGTGAATTVLLHAAASGGLQVIVHGLPALRRAVERPIGRLPRAELRSLSVMDAGDAMEISSCGEIRIEGADGSVPANVRQVSIDVLYRLQPAMPFMSAMRKEARV